MKNSALCLAAALTAAAFSGCAKRIDYSLPPDPIAFDMVSFVNPADSEDTYLSITYNGRKYICYGTIKGSINGDDVGACLGYTVQEGKADENSRIFLLKADSSANYLVEIYINGEMDQPTFFRATDTAGKDIFTPDCIESLDYGYWK